MTDKNDSTAVRRRRTRRSVLVMERLARFVITAGGLGTILAVSLIFFFLLWVVVPLFVAPEVTGTAAFPAEASAPEVVCVGTDEQRLMAWALRADGILTLHGLDDGAPLARIEPFESELPTARSFAVAGDDALLGFADGTIRSARFGFATTFPTDAEVPDDLRESARVAPVAWRHGMLQCTPEGQLRSTQLSIAIDEPLATGSESPIVRLDHSTTPSGLVFAALHEDGALRVYRLREKKNLLTGKLTRTLKQVDVPYDEVGATELPMALRLSGLGKHLFVAWRSGKLAHFDLGGTTAPRLAATRDLVEDPEHELSALSFLLGKTTLIAGDTAGRLSVWFPVRDEAVGQGALLTETGELPRGEAAVVALATSERSRLLVAGYQDGAVRLFHVTSRNQLAEVHAEQAPQAVSVFTKEDGLLAWGPERVQTWTIDRKYPEANVAGLFRPVWYEGYPEAAHVWQSSSATDDFEPKLGLMPLVFGTLKATVYSMLFGAPLALLAAIYSSEFLAARLRAGVKSTIELMASLPSVVLGFLAALVIAPFVKDVVPALLVALLLVPFTVVLGAYLWQLLPQGLSVRWAGWQRFAIISLCLPVGVLGAWAFGPVCEGLLFAGDIELWLDGQIGTGTGGLFYLLLPLSTLVVALAFGRWVNPRLRDRSTRWDRGRCARADLMKFLGASVAVLLTSFAVAKLLGFGGVDARGGFIGTYVQRNALIVGFVMGFAIVPIIYTLAEDALSEVPSQLREGSLGAGATRWQTATRIVLPTAMSGLFSAVMIGLGRAVGETMIVLMAAGNTPILEWNIFNGFRTLSANLAVELPEAVRGSTHYRTLFLAALVLFAMTFVLNTLAESVRRHFRKRARAM